MSELGKRQRKAVEVFSVPEQPAKARREEVAGTGDKLANHGIFCAELDKLKGDSELLKALHSMFYGTPGKKATIKKSLRAFSGFPAGTSVEDKVKKMTEKKGVWTVQLLKEALGVFGLEKGGSREALVERLVNYVNCPSTTGKTAKGKTKGKTAKKKGKKSGKEKKPKRKVSPSAYILFCKAHRAEVVADNEGISFGEVGGKLGAMWAELSDKEKEVWKEKAEQLKIANEALEEAEEEEQEEQEESDDGDDEDDDVDIDKELAAADENA